MTGLPEGWVPLSHFDSKDRGKGDGHSPQYKQLVSAVKEGELRGLQDAKSRRYYVPQDEANRLLIAKANKSADKASPCKDLHELGDLKEGVRACVAFVRDHLQVERHGIVDCLNATAGALERIERVLERMALAAETIATQPQTPQQELLQRIGGNGFHS
jgi:hypothetical protein